MPPRILSENRLSKLLEPQGFRLNLPEAMQYGISFVRPSSVPRLYEHILINAASPVYAEVAISAATFTSCRPCVSERDLRIRHILSGDAWYQTSRIETAAEARSWERQLGENVVQCCGVAANELGPALRERLQPILAAVDDYIERLGDVFAILDREYAFVNEATSEERAEVERIADLARLMLYLNLDDARLASLALIRFGAEVEGCGTPIAGKVPQRDDDLAARLILLCDHVRAQRWHFAGVR